MKRIVSYLLDLHRGARPPHLRPCKGAVLNESGTERATAGASTPTPDGVVLAIDFGGSKVAACACTPLGVPVARDVVETTPSLGAEANFGRATALATRLAGTAPVLAVGACTFGIPLDDGVALAPAIDGWERLALRRRLEAAFRAPAAVATDVKVAAAAEVRSGALRGSDPAIYLNLGTGLAVAVVVGGNVVLGAHGAAGEIGYGLLRSDGRGDAAAGSTAVGGTGRVLEDVVSGMGLARALDGAGRDGRGGRGSRGRTADDAARVAAVFGPATTVDERSERILGDFLEELSFHLVNLAVALDPQRIAVGGGIARAWDRIEGRLRRALSAHVPYPPELVLGAFPFDAALRGAIDLAVALVPGDGRPGAGGASLATGAAGPAGAGRRVAAGP
jgi:glucokinase